MSQTLSFTWLLFALSLPFLTVTDAQTGHKNVTLGSSLTAGNGDAAFWASKSGDFAFGFRELEPDGLFLLAIWFQNVPNRTIVWSANREKLVERGSKLEFTEAGELNLKNTEGDDIWKPRISTALMASHAAMLDTGNFVLVSSRSVPYMWQSFDEPTDTVLPSQSLSVGTVLVARYTETNFSRGRFMMMLQPDGKVELATRFLLADSSDNPYWTSTAVGENARLVFNESGSVYLAASDGTVAETLWNDAPSTEENHQRMILEYDGVIRRYVLPKVGAGSSSGWKASVEVIPSNICESVNGGMGGGSCGLNSFCKFEADRPSCHCPEGYSFFDPGDERRGCKRDFAWQDCDGGAAEAERFGFYEMMQSDWVDADYENVSASEDGCKKNCLNDCFCAAVVFRFPFCFKKRFPLSNGKMSPDLRWKSLIKIRKERSPGVLDLPGVEDPAERRRISWVAIIAVSALLCGSVILNFFVVFFSARRCRRSREEVKTANQSAGTNLQCFSYTELSKVTNGFAEKLGSGSAGTVYKGVTTVGSYVAVKKLNDMVTENDAEFKAEVNAIGRTNHRNVVQLLGFCDEGQHRLLVYEFMPKGSLASLLFNGSRLKWEDRVRIALGTAKGLLYLHEDCSNLIIHCDIKPQNILLDDSLTARISDFGLAKILKIDRTRTQTGIRGTRGYVAPEWFRHVAITPKVDVYSYGVLLLEIICGRRSFEGEAEDPDEMVLADWAYDCYASRRLDLLTEEVEMIGVETLKKYVMIAIWCIQEDQSRRPAMRQVVHMLQGILHVSDPPDPSS